MTSLGHVIILFTISTLRNLLSLTALQERMFKSQMSKDGQVEAMLPSD